MPRRRKDPDAAPIDGDRAWDRVLNKQKGYTYGYLSAEDIPVYKSMGWTREERGPDAARPVFDIGDESTAGYHVGSLTLYKAPDALAQAPNKWAQTEADNRIKTIRREAKGTGGRFTSELLR